jgi:primosomal protein N' (replication factor Y) (superfamily II helicase)
VKDLLDLAMPAAAEQLCAEIAVPLPVEGTFSYLIPEGCAAECKIGVRVQVPFTNREITGYLVSVGKAADSRHKLKPLIRILDAEPVLPQNILELTRWIADYYGCSWGEAIENALPKWVKYGKKAEKALLKQEAETQRVAAKPVLDLTLSPEQENAFKAILQSFEEKNPKPILLHGVTGSGKSEIYIRAIRERLKKGFSSICLVPEIALTEQIKHFFHKHFGEDLEILHSKLSDNERFLAWNRLERGSRRVVLGPRSALFAPLKNLGLIIIDEEHETTYKQETTPRYHAREVAEWRAQNEKALLLMGTATPSLEVMHQTEVGEVRLIELRERIDQKAMPEVRVVDLKRVIQDRRKPVILSASMVTEIEANLKKNEGTMLLLNRRGFSTHIHCPQCGWVESCKSCQVSMIFHQEEGLMLCHYCNYKKPVSEECNECGTAILRFSGFGTEKVESEVAAKFPQARIARLDADSVKKRGSHEVILKDFRDQKIDILIGTQMIAKGFDFPHVTLVGVILADVGLMLPDFRSAERTFQLLTQVAGRAGRGKSPGRVIVQTYSPEHPSVIFSKKHDFLNFYQNELPARQEYHYPPFFRLVNIIIRSKTENKAYLFARAVRDSLQETFKDQKEVELIGPSPLPFYKLRGHFRWHVMIKSPRDLRLSSQVKRCLAGVKKASGVQTALDVDPVNIL